MLAFLRSGCIQRRTLTDIIYNLDRPIGNPRLEDRIRLCCSYTNFYGTFTGLMLRRFGSPEPIDDQSRSLFITLLLS
jgi:hypothetical protein